VPGLGKTAQTSVATGCLEDSLHVTMMPILFCLCKAPMPGALDIRQQFIWCPCRGFEDSEQCFPGLKRLATIRRGSGPAGLQTAVRSALPAVASLG
jgi:hypothetical protein